MATPEEMARKMLGNVEEKTGRPLAEWLKLLQAESLEKHGQMVRFLKSEHGVTHGFASLIAHQALNSGQAQGSDEDLIEAQYAGGKAGLRPFYDAILAEVTNWGDDVEVAPKKAYVSLRRKKQFALVKPATKTRMDIGIQLKGDTPTARLVASKGSAMTSHQVSVTELGEIDAELIGWLREAYERAG